MLSFAILFIVLLSGIGLAGDEDALTAGDLPIRVMVPEGWQGEVLSEEPAEISLQRRKPPAFAGIRWIEGLQPALERVDQRRLAALLTGTQITDDSDFETEEMTIELVERDGFGPVILAHQRGGARGIDVEFIIAMFAVESGVVNITTGGRTQEAAGEALEEILAGVTFIRPAISDAVLGFGTHIADIGFAIELPEHFRAITLKEAEIVGAMDTMQEGSHKGKRKVSMFIDPADLMGEASFSCTANRGSIEVVDPVKSPLHETNYRVRTRAMQSGGAYTTQGVGTSMTTDVNIEGTGVQIAPNAEGTLELIELGEREAYLWRVAGTRGDVEVTLLTLYTAWDNVGLDCSFSTEDPDDALLEQIEASFRSIRVVDGAAHPMRLSMNAQYIKLWPWSHPALQIWWLGLAFCGLGGVGTLWVLRA